MASIQDFLEMFNNDDLDVERYFGSYDVWFNLLKKRGLMGEVDLNNASNSDKWQNEYLLWLYENDKKNYYKWMENMLADIQFDSNTGKVFRVGQREDLADLFCGRSRDSSHETVYAILSDDGDWYDRYWDTTDDVYRDVVEELNPENIERLKEHIIKNLKDKQLSPETEEMELIAAEQGHNDHWEINSENVARIINDEESMKSLLDDKLSEMKSDLYSIHTNAYNSAYEEEIYEEIWKELSDYFEGSGTWYSVPHPFKKETMIQKYKIPINDFEGIINDYLYHNKGYGQSGTLEYHGSFLGILKEDKDCLSIRFPDYPDFRKIDRNINTYFNDFF